MCTANFNDAKAGESFSNFSNYAKSKDGGAELAVGGLGVVGAINSFFDARAANNYADYKRDILMNNSRAYERAALDVVEAGRDQTAWLGFKGRAQDSAVINDMSYRGIDANSGSAKSYRQGLKGVNQIEINNTRYNAMLESFGMQNKALQAKHEAEATQLSKKNEWAGVLISLGQSAMSIYAMGANGAGSGAKSGGK